MSDYLTAYRDGYIDGYRDGVHGLPGSIPPAPPKVEHNLGGIALQSDGRKVAVCSCGWASKPAMLTATAADRHWGHAAEAAAGILPPLPEPAPVAEKRDHWYPS